MFAIKDKYPVTRGHLLVVPKRPVSAYFAMSQQERSDADELVRLLHNRILAEDQTVVAFNIGVNCGEVGGQTVVDTHIHVIPRRTGDVADPRGGVRGVIPEKCVYPVCIPMCIPHPCWTRITQRPVGIRCCGHTTPGCTLD